MIKTLTIVAALAGGLALAAPANATPLSATSASAAALGETGKLVQNVQYYRYGPRYGYRGGYYRGGRGAAVGAGVAAGILGGALAAGALAGPAYGYGYPPPAPVYAAPDADAIAYCSRRFRSYDPETGTYIGAGGVVRACP